MIQNEERHPEHAIPVSVDDLRGKSGVLVDFSRLSEEGKRAHFEEARRTTLKHVGTSEKEFQAYCRFTAHLEMTEKSRMLRVTYGYTGDRRREKNGGDLRKAMHG